MSDSIYRMLLKSANKFCALSTHTKTRETCISTSIRKHLFCVLYPKDYFHNKFSKCPCSWPVDPHVLLLRLLDNHYRDFLSYDLPKLQEVVPLARMWCMHDGAVAHVSPDVRGVLCNSYHGRWIGRGGPSAWPPRSTPDLNPQRTPKTPCTVCSSCWQRRGTSPSHCGCLSDYPQLPPYVCTDVAVHDGTCRGVHWMACRGMLRTAYECIMSSFITCTLPQV
jgi:hypothetical protein